MGKECTHGRIEVAVDNHYFGLGTYFIKLKDSNGVAYNVRVIKEYVGLV